MGAARRYAFGKSEYDRYTDASKDHFEQVLCEGSAFFDVRSFREGGQSIWMHACSKAGTLASPRILHILVQAGATIAEVDDDGWNCLFKCAGGSWVPWLSSEFEALRGHICAGFQGP